MSTQQIIRKRLHSVHNILHITQAMEMIAGVRLRKILHQQEHFLFYANKLSKVVGHLVDSLDIHHDPLFEVRPIHKIGVIVVGSDKGLCGSYNVNIFKEVEKFLKKFPPEQVELIAVGNKVIEHFKHSKWKIKEKITDLPHKLDEKNVRDMTVGFTSSFTQHDFDELWIVYTHFKSIISRSVQIKKILPLQIEKNDAKTLNMNFIFEPKPEEIYTYLMPHFFYATFHAFLLDAYASELGSRIISMKSATKNAEEMIEKLTLLRNKSRQFSITKEILEITAGAESIS